MLVVISLVVVLAVLFFPQAQRLVAKGHQAICTANLRSLGAASTLFIADNQGAFFSRKYTTDLQPYLDRRDNWWNFNSYRKAGVSCPAINAMPGGKFNTGIYGMNYVFINDIDGLIPGSPPTGWPLRLVRVAQPSKAWLFTEAGRRLANGSLDVDPLAFITQGYLQARPQPGTLSLIWPHPVQRQNFLFLDGHTELLSWESIASSVGSNSTSREYKEFYGLQD